ncbi:hypothetical protein [Kitasatospora kifunensis]|uniref:Uncharacterized protein n=1 Tax=Kitasatospora kifunensis TaxID=58351 RepID=A0A7W7R925_KITKI|nr:hypothetical protein [Kitasatospora kifunensis]MBB4927559.1 hypothetical protein [Kitasatospora kifunensis]
MSGSPMYSAVAVGGAVRAAQEARRRAQLAERRRREQARARERARLAAERAAKRAAERAARERRDQERIAQAQQRARQRAQVIDRNRAAERDERIAAFEEQRRAAATQSLREVAGLITEVRGQADPDAVFDLDSRLASLRTRILLSPDAALGAAVEELRGRVVALRRSGSAAGTGADREQQLAAVERRLTAIGHAGGELDGPGRDRCTELIGRLHTCLTERQELRFDALLGSAEHELARHAAAVARAEEQLAAARRAEAERAELAEQAELAAELERQRAETAAEQLADQLAEAQGRFEVVAQGARDAAQDAEDFAETALREQLLAALERVSTALAAGRGEPALAAVAELERLLPAAEERLDELLAAHEQRAELAQALKEAMAAAGLGFAGGEDVGQEIVLLFERANGATYETTLRNDESGSPVLSYVVEGESDRRIRPERGEITCDRTEALLDHVHELMAVDDYHPGELDWDGKPPRAGGRSPEQRGRTA